MTRRAGFTSPEDPTRYGSVIPEQAHRLMEPKGIIVILFFVFLTNRALPHLFDRAEGADQNGSAGQRSFVKGHQSQRKERRLGGYAPSFIPLGWSLTLSIRHGERRLLRPTTALSDEIFTEPCARDEGTGHD